MPERIKGANSDYNFVDGEGLRKIDDTSRTPASLHIFICPHGEPSQIEAETDYCTGITDDCPAHNPPDEDGAQKTYIYRDHALVQLHETEGAALVAGKGTTQVRVQPDGRVLIQAQAGVTVQVGEVKLVVDGDGIRLEGDLTVTGKISGSGLDDRIRTLHNSLHPDQE